MYVNYESIDGLMMIYFRCGGEWDLSFYKTYASNNDLISRQMNELLIIEFDNVC